MILQRNELIYCADMHLVVSTILKMFNGFKNIKRIYKFERFYKCETVFPLKTS